MGKTKKKKQASINLTVIAAAIFLSVFAGFWLSEQLSAERETVTAEVVDDQVAEPAEQQDPSSKETAADESIATDIETTTDDAFEEEPAATEEEKASDIVLYYPEKGNFDLDLDPEALDNTTIGWSFKRNSDHSPVVGYNQGIDLEKYDAFYINNKTEEKVVYLTFDAGYENGYTSMILDALKDNGINAAFFVTGLYVESQPDLCLQMKEEGNLVGSHSYNHPSMPEISDEEIQWQLVSTEETFKKATGYDMDRFIRPPRAEFSERTLYLTRLNGYRSVFYSMAYMDWLVDNQPGADAAYQHVMDNVHPGAVILLHAVSQSNAEALDRIITSLKEQGYRFGSLYEIPSIY